MKLKYLQCQAGSMWVRNAGEVHEVDDAAEAKRLIAAGIAEPAEPPARPAKQKEQ